MKPLFRLLPKIYSQVLGWLGLLFFVGQMLKIMLPYFSLREDTAFLLIKEPYLENYLWKTAFFTHVFTSIFALAAGLFQFSPLLLRKYKRLHRFIGRWYVINILFVTGPSGLVLAFFANGGMSSRLGFTLLAALWMYFTWKAWQTIRRGETMLHRQFMVRSFALTLSAVSLRAWKWLLVLAFAPPPMEVYRWVTWLGFVPNLLVAELLIRRQFSSPEATLRDERYSEKK